MADIIDIGIANDVFLELRQRPLSKRQSEISWFRQSYVNDHLALLITEFWAAATILIFRFENLEPPFIKSVDNVSCIITTKAKTLADFRNPHALSRRQNDLGTLHFEGFTGPP
jgi:hypothetical protein